MRYIFLALLLFIPLVSCGQTGPGSCPTQTMVGNAGGGLTCLTSSAVNGIIGGGGGGSVSSVANTDSTLVVSPTTGAVIASFNLSRANVWVGTQTFPNNTLTNAELSQMPADTVKCNNTGSTANAADCISPKTYNYTFITSAGAGINDQSTVAASSATFWTNVGPAVVHRMNRLMVGVDSTAGSQTPPTPPDWLESLVNCTTQCGQISSVSGIGVGAFVGGSRTSDALTVFGTPSGGSAGIYAFGYDDDTISAADKAIAVGANGIGINKSTAKGITIGAQQDIDCNTPTYVANPLNFENASGATCLGLLVTAGAFSSVATTSPSAALVIAPGVARRFAKGQIFAINSLDNSIGSGGHGVAVEMYPGMTQRWYDATTVFAEVGTGTGGEFGINTNSSQWLINGIQSVSCAAGTVSIATFTVTNGIVTHC